MMVCLLILFWLMVAGTLQALVPTWAHLGEPAFPILLGVVLYVATHKKARHFIWVALAAGVLADAMSLVPFGVSSLSFLASATVAMVLREDFYPDRALVAMVLGALCTAVSTLALGLLLRIKGMTTLAAGDILVRMGGSAVLGAVIMPLLFGLLRAMERRLGTLEARI